MHHAPQKNRRDLSQLDDLGFAGGRSVPSEYQTGRYRDFVNLWHEGLIVHGVQNYSDDQAWRDYQMALLACLYIPVSFHYVVSSKGGRGLSLARAIMHQIFRAAVECNAVSVLER